MHGAAAGDAEARDFVHVHEVQGARVWSWGFRVEDLGLGLGLRFRMWGNALGEVCSELFLSHIHTQVGTVPAAEAIQHTESV
jgi:hypothetical protein